MATTIQFQSGPKVYPRLSVPQRLEHWAYAISFATLGITGIPQKFAGTGWAETWIGLMGGIELTRVIHHTAAIVMALAAIYHVIVLAYKVFVLRVRWTMFPRLDDAIDGIDAIRYNLGLSREHPKMDRYNFAEKMEYWAGAWGTVVMAITGFIMWNPITAAKILPGDLIPASKAAHGAEAILALGAILIWHFYSVHIKTLNKAVFNGHLTEQQMKQEHALELERIQAGKTDRRPPENVIKQRERSFIPIATIAALGMLIALFLATSYESTAITTLPRRPQVQVYAPVTPTPVGTPSGTAVSSVKALPASHEGRTTCVACHQNLTQPKMPADHAGRADATCTGCHKVGGTAPVSGGISPIPANHAGRTTCIACHQNLTDPKLPADHQGRVDSTCGGCHKPAQAGATSSSASTSSASSSASSASSGISPIPADHAGRTTCVGCHQNLPQPKLPADHAGRTDATCTGCHKPAGTSGASSSASSSTASSPSSGISPIPTSHTGRTVCAGCHQALPDPKLPADHAGRTDATCTGCHKPAATSGASASASSSTAATGPSAQPASHAGRTVCLGCHQALPDPKLPADHAGRTDATCVACHKAP